VCMLSLSLHSFSYTLAVDVAVTMLAHSVSYQKQIS
jgi:hypothetical protein